MEKKVFTDVSDVAHAIGLNHDALELLDYLDQYHPDLALDYEFIMQRVELAKEAYKNVLEGVDGDNPAYSAYLQEADNQRYQTLMSGLEFSKYSIVFNIVDTYYYDKNDTRDEKEVRKITLKIQPSVESIFAQYPCDTEFEASCEYDKMTAKLKQKIHKILDKMEELPF
ncbi:hypothetical protein FACS189456_4810 [Bacteroidia bacterium]|nr:hypothetical protein FACS189456_4810 [Bacteroidia bacterium]